MVGNDWACSSTTRQRSALRRKRRNKSQIEVAPAQALVRAPVLLPGFAALSNVLIYTIECALNDPVLF